MGYHHLILCHSVSVLHSSHTDPMFDLHKANRKSGRQLLSYLATRAHMVYFTGDSDSLTYSLSQGNREVSAPALAL